MPETGGRCLFIRHRRVDACTSGASRNHQAVIVDIASPSTPGPLRSAMMNRHEFKEFGALPEFRGANIHSAKSHVQKEMSI